MKTINYCVAILIAFNFISVANAQTITKTESDTIAVWGNCEMCKSRIEKAATQAEAISADWNVETKFLTVSFSTDKTTALKIEEKIASVGHDTKNFTAPAAVYNKLEGCCKYERKTSNDISKTTCCKNGSCTTDGCKTGGECKASCSSSMGAGSCCNATTTASSVCAKGQNCCSSSKKS